MTDSALAPQSLIACPDCDLLLQKQPCTERHEGHCPRCGARLWREEKNHIDISLSASIAGLCLFFPALLLPILHLDLMGQQGDNTLLSGVSQLWQANEKLLAPLIFVCSILAPFLQLLLTTLIGLCLRSHIFPSYFPVMLKANKRIQSLSMLEIYTMGVLVAYIKMLDPGEVSIATGSFCLAGLLICIILSTQYFHAAHAWQQWEQAQDYARKR
ncbi:MAG: paraquat-inducible protein A [Spongiibacteraceae bacterium]